MYYYEGPFHASREDKLVGTHKVDNPRCKNKLNKLIIIAI
jgi:hypothetical protein